jgi:D-alanine-D-alanine ligase
MSALINVAVLFGGRDTEPAVSGRSALGVLHHLDRSRYRVTPVRITADGVLVAGSDHGPPTDVDELLAMTPGPGAVTPLAGIAGVLRLLEDVDVAFPCLTGPNGSVQSLCRMAGTPYVGSGLLAGATAMDREFTTKFLSAAGFAVADQVVLGPADETVAPADRERLGLPVFVKPARGGKPAGVGVSRVDDWAELPAALAEARARDSKVLVEAAVHGREIDVGVLEKADGTLVAAPALEIRPADDRGFRAFDPADLTALEQHLLVDAATRIFRVLGCAGLLRAGFFLTERNGRSVAVVNGITTIPGLTAASRYPRMWQAAGLSLGELLDELIGTALAAGRRPMAAVAA